jgi:Chaperone of endosialidase/Lower baseplate protein N-terminal domain
MFIQAVTAGVESNIMTLDRTNGNVWIWTASPAHQLSVWSTTSDSQTVTIRGYSNSPANWKWGGAFWYTSASVIMWELNGVAQIWWHTSTLNGWSNLAINSAWGNVGIWTTTPTEKLHVAWSLRIDGATSGIRIFKNGSASIDSQLYLANAANTRAYNWQLNSDGSGLDFWTFNGSSWANQITYLANGNVGIWTTTPWAKLDVAGWNVMAQQLLYARHIEWKDWNNNSTVGDLYLQYNNNTNNTNINNGRLFVRGSDGNVGIWTTSPSQKLDVAGNANITGTMTATAFVGNGAWLTNITATSVPWSWVTGKPTTISWYGITDSATLFNNMGQPHSTQTDFNTPTDFWPRFIQWITNWPGIPSAGQYYNFALWLWSEYAYSQYAMQFAIPRVPVGWTPYPSVRFREGGTWWAWSKIYAGYADTAGTATNATQLGWVAAASYALLASPALTGTPTAPTAAVNTSTTQLATTAYVNAEIANDAPTKTWGWASGTWWINITGNAATATTSTNATNATNWQSTSHAGVYWLNNAWDWSRWYLTSNHGAPVRVGYADSAWAATNIVSSGPGTADLDAQLNSGMYGWTPTTANRPSDGYGQAIGILSAGTIQDNANNWLTQLGFGTSGNTAYFRTKVNNNSFGAWYTLLHSGNYNSYSPTLTWGWASGTWGINVTGNAATATTATNASQLWGLNPSDYARWTAWVTQTNFNTIKQPGLYQYDWWLSNTPNWSPNYRSIEIGSAGRYSQIALPWDQDSMWFRRQTDAAWSTWREVIHSGNIWSQSVNYANSAWAVAWANVTSKSLWDTARNDTNLDIWVSQYMRWKNYGNSHVIIDASQGTAPNGSAINNTNSQVAWSASYPTLMGWNGANTYWVRVDSARVSDSASSVPWSWVTGKPTTAGGYGITDVVTTSWDQTISGNKTFNNDITVVGRVITDTLVNRTVAQLSISWSIFPVASSSQKDIGATGNRWANLWLSGNANISWSVTANVYLTSSDKNLKKDITILTGSLDRILALRGYNFSWRSDSRKDIGIIAQEVEKQFPEIVHTDSHGLKSVEYANLIAPMIEAMREQQSLIEKQQQEIDTLKKSLENIQSSLR